MSQQPPCSTVPLRAGWTLLLLLAYPLPAAPLLHSPYSRSERVALCCCCWLIRCQQPPCSTVPLRAGWTLLLLLAHPLPAAPLLHSPTQSEMDSAAAAGSSTASSPLAPQSRSERDALCCCCCCCCWLIHCQQPLCSTAHTPALSGLHSAAAAGSSAASSPLAPQSRSERDGLCCCCWLIRCQQPPCSTVPLRAGWTLLLLLAHPLPAAPLLHSPAQSGMDSAAAAGSSAASSPLAPQSRSERDGLCCCCWLIRCQQPPCSTVPL